MQGLSYLTNPSSVFLSQRILTIDSFTRHIFVTAQLYSGPICASVDSGICGSQVPRCLVFNLLSNPFALFLSVYGGQFHIVKDESGDLVLIIKCTFLFSCSHPIFFACPFRGNFIPYVSTIVPSPLVFPSCLISWVTFHDFFLQGMPPSRASPSVDLFHGVVHCIGFLITGPRHGSPHSFCNPFIQEGQANLYPYLPRHIARSCMLVDPCFFFVFLKWNRRNIAIVSHRPFLTPKSKDCIDVVNQSWTLDFPRNVFAFVCENISFQKALFADCILSSMASCGFRCRFMAPPKIMNFSSKGKFVAPTCSAQNHVNLFFRIIRACPPQTRWFGYQVPSVCFFNQVS